MQLVKHVEFFELYVEDANRVAERYARTFGFRPIAEAGPETGMREHRSVVLAAGSARMIVTSALEKNSPAAQYVGLHGDGVRDIAFAVDDAVSAFQLVVERGAVPVKEPVVMEDELGRIVTATVGGFGDVVHTLIQRDGTSHPSFLPRYRPVEARVPAPAAALTAIDHVAMCLETGTLDATTEYYQRVFGFVNSYEQYIETQLSGMNARVVQNETGQVQFPMQEPLVGSRGPIGDFVDKHHGSGVYHVGLLTDDIIPTLRQLRQRDVSVLETPRAYYDMLPARVGKIDENIDDLRELHVLVDRDSWGYLLQVFTRSLHRQNAFFIEVLQRKNARSFGNANVKALFDAVEREALG